MEIGMPMNVRHVSHVTYDCFNGFVGLPDEFEIEVSRRPPSARKYLQYREKNIYGTRKNKLPDKSLQDDPDSLKDNGLDDAEGIFRINPENGQEEYVREQLNMGLMPENVDIHCLAGLIKAWFRELPNGLLDSLPPEQVMQAQSEEDYVQLLSLLPPTESHLFHWAIDLMADVAQLEHLNKMNARNIATVFAPNMTQMSDSMTAITYAIRLMNFLKTLIEKTLKDRQYSVLEAAPSSYSMESSDENGDHGLSKPINNEKDDDDEEVQLITPAKDLPPPPCSSSDHEHKDESNAVVITRDENENLADHCSLENPMCIVNMCRDDTVKNAAGGRYQTKSKKKKTEHSNTAKVKKNAALLAPLKLQNECPEVKTGSSGA